jgi:precorrin-6B methylase 2
MRQQATQRWTAEKVLTLGRSYQGAAVLAAAADLNLFDALAAGPRRSAELARLLHCDLRGLTILLDALTALRLLKKTRDAYLLPSGLKPLLTSGSPQTVLAMAQHQANCLRNWAQLATVVKTGRPARKLPSVRGAAADYAAFIGAMHNVSAPQALPVIRAIRPLKFKHLLDLGGASGTWTMAFLRACPRARATLFDLPHVIPMARQRLARAGMLGRVRLVAGDFTAGPLPAGADLAWVSAIVHQNSRRQNRALFAGVFAALVPGGRIVIRDILMDESRSAPPAGALFAVNMLVATPGGGTFTLRELRADLESAGFSKVAVLRRDEAMNSILAATKPG